MTRKRKPGRPRKPRAERRTEVLSVRLRSDVMAAIESQSEGDELTASSWAAEVLGQACGLMPGPYNLSRPKGRGLIADLSSDHLEEESGRALAKELSRK